MTSVTYAELCQDLAGYMDVAVESHTPIVVRRQSGQGDVVILAEADFLGWQETVHLLSRPRNAERLVRSIQQIEAGAAREHALTPAERAPRA